MTTLAHSEFIDISNKLHECFKIQEILIEKLAYHFPVYEAQHYMQGETSFSVGIETKVLKSNTCLIIKTITILLKSKTNNNLADVKFIFSFEHKDGCNYVEPDKNGYTIQPIANDFLDNIVIATSRGIVFSGCQGTLLNKALLPLWRPDEAQKNS